MREKQNPVEKEWAAVVKAEERFLRPCHAGADGGLAGEDHALCATEAGGDSAHRFLQSV